MWRIPSLALAATPIITGRIADSRGKPITGATVRVQNEDGRSAEFVTDNHGAFRVQASGRFHLEIRHEGYRSVRSSVVSVSAGNDDVYQIDDIQLLAGNSDSLDTVVLQLEEVANPEARNDPTVREGLPKSDRLFGPGIQNVDMALARRIRLSDSVAAQLRTDFYNAFNHPNFVAPPTMQNFADASDFGALFVARSPRIVQLGLKFLW